MKRPDIAAIEKRWQITRVRSVCDHTWGQDHKDIGDLLDYRLILEKRIEELEGKARTANLALRISHKMTERGEKQVAELEGDIERYWRQGIAHEAHPNSPINDDKPVILYKLPDADSQHRRMSYWSEHENRAS